MEQKKTALLTVGEGDFERLVLDSPQPAVVDFSAVWCGPCRSIAPVIDGLANDCAERVTVATVDIDDNPRLVLLLGAIFAADTQARLLIAVKIHVEYPRFLLDLDAVLLGIAEQQFIEFAAKHLPGL